MNRILFSQEQVESINNLRIVDQKKNKIFENTLDSIKWNWHSGGQSTFTLTQSSSSNWIAGGNNFSIAANGFLNYFFRYKEKRVFWDNTLDLSEGYVQSSTNGGRKNDDRIDFLSKGGYKLDTSNNWYISGLFNFRSQFFDGRNYTTDSSFLTSSFLSPAYIISSIGFDSKFFNNHLSIFYSPLTSRVIYVNNKKLRLTNFYNVDSVSGLASEFGLFMVVNFQKYFLNKIYYKGRLDLFSNYLKKPENLKFYMTNFFEIKVKNNFGISYNLDLIYDDGIKQFGKNMTSPALQIRSQIGVSYSLLVKTKYKTRTN